MRPRGDEDSDVASLREPGHSPKKARVSAFPAVKAWNRDAAYDEWQASERCDETSTCVRTFPSTAVGETVSTAVGVESRNALAAMREVLMTVDVKRVLEDLGNLPKSKLPPRIERKGDLAHDGWGADFSEVYSPPRVAELAGKVGLQFGSALDFTTTDEEGNPWDFILASQRAKAVRLLEAEKPLMLVACPMCGPFSSLNYWNYQKSDEKTVRQKLECPLTHLKFSLELCIRQCKAGRCFVFEHPAAASSWTTQLVQKVLSFEGVYLAKFDFCQLGMTTPGAQGEALPAKKRTAVLTNSKNLAETLRLAQCQGRHTHEPLVGGRAKACEAYPEKFVQLVIEAIRKEIEDAKWTRA